MYLFEPLKKQAETYLSKEHIDLLKKAYVVAHDAHDGQMRSSGDPYITHPVAVARNLADMHLDHETLMAALLHDVIEDTEVTQDELAELFGSTVAELVEGVSKLDKLSFSNHQEAQAENFRKMIMAMVQDIRVILIKLADRTHNMRTLGSLRPDKRRRIARETLDIYAPIANRLGIHGIKSELEVLGFEALYPMRSRALKEAVIQARGNRKEIIANIKDEIESRLAEFGIVAQVIGREKHLYSIYRKMLNKELMFNEVMDIYAFRIVVDESYDTCYRALGAVHNLFKPIETRFKDYIAIPKSNGYQSLHTSLIGPHGIPVEIQIRTQDMDQMADKGVAAHWLYKQDKDDSSGTTAQVRARKWMQSLLELQQSAGSSFEFIENVKTDLFPEEIYVFTPDGKIIELPMGATAVDFAYAVHTDVGNSCVGAKVERKPYPLRKPLLSGQIIEVITSSGARPNATWLNFVVTAKARMQIRNYLRSMEQNESLNLGHRLLTHALGATKLSDIDLQTINEVVQDTGYDTLDDLMTNIGLGNELSIGIARRLTGEFTDDSEEPSYGKSKMPIKGSEGMLVSYGKCCHPIPGDDIVAYISSGKGLMVHQDGCRNINGREKELGKFFPVKWDNDIDKEFVAALRIEIINHQGALAKLTSVISQSESNIRTLNSEEKDSNIYLVTMEITCRDRVHIANIIRKIKIMVDVERVTRPRK
ncbi:bifunctional GTP diphosphokinase/guanosine-3',5'-bis pyrophosphate 3'-pyrophosphohydrolase [Thalassomonas sp. M1454]|uniref:bifunctional GTP diphosphokinase/guanosine-3',5'-bis pyrophosphate 3'-pyrophosphohydrolase n=1 Tax=Thalassomonas sp. M1454 TaxID=2594477 RepID=UPI00117F3350|nr:bifunctional GTP diphosphokinase/guanosine-3',5'-bis pyrophosphate 3'-pyrophosphohydrolase [Thalassomonas sp. M1454]TRX55103.1 bifunctional GTP diphosphokinase/guanosine-3',5'-bis pyrophosphate 3'-pyrophosphohydrolase [Thalassomonas sp. M1454]